MMGSPNRTSAWLTFAQRSRDEGGLGLAPHQAAGIVGNLVHESGQDLNPWGPTGDNGTAWGTAQWRGDRLARLKARPDYQTLEGQQAFMREELDGSENKAYRALLAAKTAEEAAHAWDAHYERSDGSTRAQRMQSARALMDQFGEGAADSSAMSYAPTERKSMPALSADSVMGPGILNMGAGAEGGADVIGRGLTGMGAALAGISSPEQGKALTALQASMMKAPGNKWSVAHVDPKTGQALLTNGQSFVPWNAFTPKPDEDEYVKNFKKEDAKNIVDLGTNLSNAAADAVNQQTTVGELRKAFSNPQVQQGILGPYRQQMDKLYTWFGFGDPSKVADGDMANALSNKLALQLVNNGGTKLLPGSFSDSDRKFVTQMATSLSNDPAANMRLLDIYERSNNRVLEAEALRQRVADANGGVLPPSFRTELGSLRKKWSEEDKARDTAPPASTTPAAKTDKPNTFKTKSGVTWSY
jgi:hypothetical protein